MFLIRLHLPMIPYNPKTSKINFQNQMQSPSTANSTGKQQKEIVQ